MRTNPKPLRGRTLLTLTLTVLALAIVASCQGDESTALRVVVKLGAGITVDQLRLVASSKQLTLDQTLPRRTKPLASGTDVVILIGEDAAGSTTHVIVSGLAAGTEAARGSADVSPVAKKTIAVEVTLKAVVRCPTAQHDCDGQCVLDIDPAHCGLACRACPTSTEHGSIGCRDDACAAICQTGYASCGTDCVDLKTDPKHCGDCATACRTGEPCLQGRCRGADGGAGDGGARDGGARDGGARDAGGCGAGTHDCSGSCVSNSDVAHCGSQCTPCVPPTYGTATCNGTSCGFTCGSGYQVCGSACCAASCSGTGCTYGYTYGGCCADSPYCATYAGGALTCRNYCGNIGERCGYGTDCCNSNCVGGYCAQPSCAGTGCTYGYTYGGCCADSPFCVSSSGSLTCRNYCGNVGERCGYGTDCCNNNCVGGYCAAPSCLNQACTAGYAHGGCCATEPYCVNYYSQPTQCRSACGGASNHCQANSDCCSGVCTYNAGAGWNTCQCGVAATRCTTTSDCCSNVCFYDSSRGYNICG
ncbi:MAG TPA: hypothetical protein VGQ83_01880 [Polyangia bacterium]